MPGIDRLEDLPIARLLQELRNRESASTAPSAALDAELRDYGDEAIVAVLKDSQKLIYGSDDRSEVFQLSPGPDLDDADSVVALFGAASVADNGDGTSSLRTVVFGEQHNLCAGERFRDQPAGAFCSGFLVAPDIVATAGHCVNSGNVTGVRFVFGFRMRDATAAQTVERRQDLPSAPACLRGRAQYAVGSWYRMPSRRIDPGRQHEPQSWTLPAA